MDNLNDNRIFGINLVEAYDLELDKKYNLIKNNTSYLKNTAADKVKDIKFSYFKDIIILLKTGIVLVNGKEKERNVKRLHFVDGICIFSIDNDNRISCLTYKDAATKLINNNNYKYKKIILTPLCIVALTYEKTVKFFGNFMDAFIDYTKFYDVDDIGYEENNDDIVVIKNDKLYSLFSQYDYYDKFKASVQLEDIVLNDISIISK